MALDQQSNWDIEMSQPRKPIQSQSFSNTIPIKPSSSIHMPEHQWSREILLPGEIISQILSYIPKRPSTSSQTIYYNCCLVSRAWYSACIALLYSSPHLDGANFTQVSDLGGNQTCSKIFLNSFHILANQLYIFFYETNTYSPSSS